jgi:hypothetical protein
MGSHQRDLGKTRTSANEAISKRYGKWRNQMRPGSTALLELNKLGIILSHDQNHIFGRQRQNARYE